MELNPKDERPLTARFTSPRDLTLVAPDGSRCQIFKAGETVQVHRDLFGEAINHGMVPADPDDLSPPKPVENQTQEVAVKDGLVEACKVLIARGNPGDFTIPGFPRAASAKKLVDFDFTTRDLKEAFAEAMHEVEQDGDDSTEHSE